MAIEPLNNDPYITFPNGKLMGGLMYIKTAPDTYVPWDGTVEISFGATSLALNDGVDNDIKATVIDFLSGAGDANPLAVILTDTDGVPYNAAGGGGGGAVTIADGADVAEGATTDAAVTGDNTGTVSAKLRGINKILADVWDSINSRLKVYVQNATIAVTQSGSWVISAGSNIIGTVRIDQTTPGTTNGVQVNAALPAGNNNIGDVDIASSALPTGASTLAEQQTQTTELTAIKTSVQILDDWDESDRAKVNPIVGQAGVAAGTGVDGVTVQRVSLATNVPLPAGTNNIGDVDVLTLPALPAGTNLIGNVGTGKTCKTKTGSASATFTIVAAVTSKKIRVYSLSLMSVSATAVTVTFKDGAAGTAVGTYIIQAPTSVSNGIAESISVPSFLFETSAGVLLEMSFSAAVSVTYNLRYWDDD